MMPPPDWAEAIAVPVSPLAEARATAAPWSWATAAPSGWEKASCGGGWVQFDSAVFLLLSVATIGDLLGRVTLNGSGRIS